jgi:hypothetical protein
MRLAIFDMWNIFGMSLLNEMRFSGENIKTYDGFISTLDREFAVAIVIVENVFCYVNVGCVSAVLSRMLAGFSVAL